MSPDTIGSPLLWAAFLVFVLAMLALDLGVFHRQQHAVTLKEAAIWSGVWVALAALFGWGVHHWHGPERALEFATGYVIEKALSVDNLFVFVVIFRYFAVPPALQHRVLFWGILGALAMRALFIFLGGAFLASFHWAIYVFGGILVFTGIRLLQTEAPALPAYVEIIDTDLALTGELHLARACERIERTDGQFRVLECVAWAPRP